LSSNAFSIHLQQLLRDAEELDDAHARLRTGHPGRQYGLASLNRATVIMSISAWESYVEELLRDCLLALRPAAPPLGSWPALNAHVLGLLARFDLQRAWSAGYQNVVGLAKLHRAASGATPGPSIDVPASNCPRSQPASQHPELLLQSIA
jgi:hypothetical protein